MKLWNHSPSDFLWLYMIWLYCRDQTRNQESCLDNEVELDSRRGKSLLFSDIGSLRAGLTHWAMTISQLSGSAFVCHNNTLPSQYERKASIRCVACPGNPGYCFYNIFRIRCLEEAATPLWLSALPDRPQGPVCSGPRAIFQILEELPI